MIASEDCVALIKRLESFESKAYPDEGGVWTIGYGTTDGVFPGMEISEPLAEKLLRARIEAIARSVTNMVTVKLNQNQFDALVSFAYNTGVDALKNSTLLRRLNIGRFDLIPDEMRRWINVKKKPSDGLKNRRADEIKLFLKPVTE